MKRALLAAYGFVSCMAHTKFSGRVSNINTFIGHYIMISSQLRAPYNASLMLFLLAGPNMNGEYVISPTPNAPKGAVSHVKG